MTLVIVSWGGGTIWNPAQAQLQPQSPIQHIDHIMIRTDRPAEIYALLTDVLRLPVAWPLADRGGVVSGGVGFGNNSLTPTVRVMRRPTFSLANTIQLMSMSIDGARVCETNWNRRAAARLV